MKHLDLEHDVRLNDICDDGEGLADLVEPPEDDDEVVSQTAEEAELSQEQQRFLKAIGAFIPVKSIQKLYTFYDKPGSAQLPERKDLLARAVTDCGGSMNVQHIANLFG